MIRNLENDPKLFEAIAKTGNAEYMMRYAKYCMDHQMMEQALYWMKRVADDGEYLQCSAFVVGSLYKQGIGCQKDRELAIHYLTIACENGSVEARKELDEIDKPPSKKGLYIFALALGMTGILFYYKGFAFGIRFFVLDWVLLAFIVRFFLHGNMGSLDREAGLPGGTVLLSVLTCFAVVLAMLIFR